VAEGHGYSGLSINHSYPKLQESIEGAYFELKEEADEIKFGFFECRRCFTSSIYVKSRLAS
jgi:hypothetical protein